MWSSYLIVAVSLVASAYGFGSGAPTSACVDMQPKHPAPAQTTPAPYTITTSTKVVKAGTPLQVVVSGKSAKDTMRGLLLQAREGNKIIGSFTLPPNDKFTQLIDCSGKHDAVTHKSHEPEHDQQTATYTWTAPKDYNGEIKFRATIALNGAVYWIGVESAPVKVTN